MTVHELWNYIVDVGVAEDERRCFEVWIFAGKN